MMDEERFLKIMSADLATTSWSGDYLSSDYYTECSVGFDDRLADTAAGLRMHTTAIFRMVSSCSIYITDLDLFIDEGINYTVRTNLIGVGLGTEKENKYQIEID